jgi:hypothetical protein
MLAESSSYTWKHSQRASRPGLPIRTEVDRGQYVAPCADQAAHTGEAFGSVVPPEMWLELARQNL